MKNLPIKIGVGCAVVNNNQVLLSRRLSSHGEGTWSFPGGHLEPNESPFSCAVREVFEESGVVIKPIQIITWTLDTFIEKECHYLTVLVEAKYISGNPLVKEPDKQGDWYWFDKDKLPSPLFKPIHSLREYGYFEKIIDLSLVNDI